MANFELLKKYRRTSGQQKLFIWTCALFWLAIVGSTVYAYLRLIFPALLIQF